MGKNLKKAFITNLGILTIVFVVILGFHKSCFGSDSGDAKDEMNQKLIQRIEQLEKKIEDLTGAQEKPVVTVPDEIVRGKVEAILMEKEGHGGFMQMPKIRGFIDTTYNYNFNKPASQTTKLGTPGTTTAGSNLSSYVTKANDITFNTAHIAFNGLLKEGIGYTIEVDAGSDANVNTPTSGSGSADDFDLQEAYLTASLFDTGVNLKVGKFVTLEGIEVIESPLNPTISRGYLYGLAEPFTHVGFLLSRELPIKGLELRAGLVNGWDVLSDNNDRKTFLGGLGINYGDLATGGLSVYYGPEQANNGKNDRTSIDLTVFTKPMPKLTIGLQGNWGREDGIGSGTDHWQGYGVQPVYQLTDKFSLAGRVEYMKNKGGSRFGNSGGEITNFAITPGYKLNDSTTARVEYRHDMGNKDFFEGENGGVFDKDSANQLLAEVFYTF
ncbi:MAG: hypothetical protein A2787_05645 [Omnitrophica WOR_2 bacterium RIFCSPHIGHO2_01_FULL_48_9]|nr:MAG: hypothetical protein A3D10_07670 [Omnitrophica WOR_2 bacterium RIFCSPHIGHO2_02_FULL_48_11]OGX32884.1 MAG: hypothetical protein A2787_05645 [Omnitrophica WOR_2 bacterium RIFCSPHIGHO2_01_FULL_48_9]